MVSNLEVEESHLQHPNWPAIKGLKDTSKLLQGNLNLFAASIKNLLNTYDDIESMADGEFAELNDEQQQEMAARLHKLRSTAGIVGAQQLYDFASSAEIDLRSQKAGAESLLMRVGQTLTELRENSREFLQDWSDQQANETDINLSKTEAISQADLTALIIALENNDMSASKMIDNFSLQIKVLIGTEQFEQLNQLVQDMKYQQAAELLKQQQGS
jgi:HPt (histidine-containing phosphotransfer) domain-containing protein